jgi:DNA repair exonuclease SbcCD ATPase subunit
VSMLEVKMYSDKMQKLKARRAIMADRVEELWHKEEILAKLLHATEEAQVFIQQVAKDTQEKLRFHLEDIVNLAMDVVFPGEYDFRIIFEIKRGKTEARLCFIRNGVEIDPLSSSGGGVSDVCSFALRIAVWSLGETVPVMIFDEPFRNLSKDLQSKASEMLKQLSQRLKIQMIMSTHEDSMVDVADRLFKVKLVRDGDYRKSIVRSNTEEERGDS